MYNLIECNKTMFNLKDFEIIGYTEQPTDSTVPCILPPVFINMKINADPVILLPPYSIFGSLIIGATVENNFDNIKSILRVLPKNIPVKENYELWMDIDMNVFYNSRFDVTKRFNQLNREYYKKSLNYLQHGDFTSAEKYISYAISANSNHINSWVLRAVLRRKEGKHDHVELIHELIKELINYKAFMVLIEFYEELI